MKCPHCGYNEKNRKAAFCTNCGHAIKKSQETRRYIRANVVNTLSIILFSIMILTVMVGIFCDTYVIRGWDSSLQYTIDSNLNVLHYTKNGISNAISMIAGVITTIFSGGGIMSTLSVIFVVLFLVLAIGAFVTAIIIIYKNAIVAFFKIYCSIKKGQTLNIYKEVYAIATTYIAYYLYEYLYSYHTYGILGFFNRENFKMTISDGWGATMCWIVILPTIIFAVIARCIQAQDEQNTKEVINKFVALAVPTIVLSVALVFVTKESFVIEGNKTSPLRFFCDYIGIYLAYEYDFSHIFPDLFVGLSSVLSVFFGIRVLKSFGGALGSTKSKFYRKSLIYSIIFAASAVTNLVLVSSVSAFKSTDYPTIVGLGLFIGAGASVVCFVISIIAKRLNLYDVNSEVFERVTSIEDDDPYSY